MFRLGKYKVFIALILFSTIFTGCAKKESPVVDTAIEPVKVAVSSEFLPTASLLADQFTTNTGIAVEFSSGSNQELVEMIIQGSDFDVFMASDTEHPNDLIDRDRAMSEGASVYALGKVALYSKSWKLNWNARQYLESGQFSKIAIPNPDNRYGEAGILALENIGVYKVIENKLVHTENEKGSLELVETKKVDAGFIMYSSLSDREKRWAWIVPQEVYEPIEQGSVLIKRETINDSSKIWMGYLSTDEARSIIRQSGYGVVDNQAGSTSK